MAKEGEFSLYGQTAIELVTLDAGTNIPEFWETLSQHVVQSDDGKVEIRLTFLSERVLRVQRRNKLGARIAIHMAVYEKPIKTGSEIRLQPLIAWLVKKSGTGETELLQGQNSAVVATLQALRSELPKLALSST